MRVVVLPADTTGCGAYRCIWPAAVVQQTRPDWRVEVYRPGDIKMSLHPDGSLQAIQGLEDPRGIDVLVVQRIGTSGNLQFVRWVQSLGAAVVVDADDALWCIDKDNRAYRSWNNHHQHWSFMDQAAVTADLVTVTTEALAKRYGKHGRVVVLPNRVPAGVTALESVRQNYPETVTVGWSGFTATHPRDLPVVGDAVRRTVDEHGVHVRIIGDGKGVGPAWGIDTVEATGPVPVDRYLSSLTCLDVALVPLLDGPFNRAKSGLKAAEFSAAGVPVIASPTPANRQLVKDGYPLLLADTPTEWHTHLTRLVTDPAERAERGEAARQAADRWSLEESITVWVEAWERAAQRRTRLASA